MQADPGSAWDDQRLASPADRDAAGCRRGLIEGDHMEASEGRSGRRAGDADGAARSPDEHDERENLAEKREAALDAREVRADARDLVQADRQERATHILADADQRDHRADARDVAAATRDTAASLRSFLHDSADEYGPALKARRSAAIDRTDAKSDRTSAASDRSELAGDGPTPPDVDNG
jgi:hypothetical protein